MRQEDFKRLVRLKIVGESMREIGVLILIFVPLDLMLEWNQKIVFRYPVWLHGRLSWLTPETFWVPFFIVEI